MNNNLKQEMNISTEWLHKPEIKPANRVKWVFRVLVLQFVNKSVKSHQDKTNTKSCDSEGLRCIIYEI